jgi:predicted transposase/invertase (TIGR01784 family)
MRRIKEKRYNPLNDFLFMKLFGEKGDEEQLLALINAILYPDGTHRLEKIDIKESTKLTKEFIEDKSSILDILASTDDMKVNIEIQLRNLHNMDRRSLYYWSRLYTAEAKSGDQYEELPKVININIMDCNFLGTKSFHSVFRIREDTERDYILTDALEIHFIEMPKFRKYKAKSLNNPLHRMLMYFDVKTDTKIIEEIIEMDTALKKVHEKTEELMRSDEAYRNYLIRRDMSKMDRNSEAKYQFNRGMQQGIVKGMEQGIVKGMEQGIVKGMRNSRNEMIIYRLNQGDSPEQVTYLLNVSIDEVLQIANPDKKRRDR